jgi:hypothetical protein
MKQWVDPESTRAASWLVVSVVARLSVDAVRTSESACMEIAISSY